MCQESDTKTFTFSFMPTESAECATADAALRPLLRSPVDAIRLTGVASCARWRFEVRARLVCPIAIRSRWRA